MTTPGSAIARPMLRVRVHNPPRPTDAFLALVDSGADVTMFNVDVAADVGIDLAARRAAGAVGIGGTARVYVCSVELEVEGLRFPADVHFNADLPPTVALLGRRDVFARFRFGFDQRGPRLLTEPYG